MDHDWPRERPTRSPLPVGASFLPDDLPTEARIVFVGDPLVLPTAGEQHATLDAILCHVQHSGVVLTAWSTVTSLRNAFPAHHRVPVALGLIGYEESIMGFLFEDGTTRVMMDGLTAAITHVLAALRIMQQPYAVQARERAPRASPAASPGTRRGPTSP